ncbi:LysM peptidoglycan-binding domain-containing protein [Carboxydocella sp. ULO1]|uniref:LysM peptidoglycan-binding domain-containing protein n=1 Tax=Carboxydocella sp. ULO1 TaxID=1926599 RepID=UPI0009ACBE06
MRKRKKYRLNLVAILVIVSLILSIYSFYANYTSASEKSYTTYVVAPGDTLWAISKKFYPEQRDILEGVDIICEANSRDGKPLDPIIYPGQVLIIPLR